jgi:hypothetical protein
VHFRDRASVRSLFFINNAQALVDKSIRNYDLAAIKTTSKTKNNVIIVVSNANGVNVNFEQSRRAQLVEARSNLLLAKRKIHKLSAENIHVYKGQLGFHLLGLSGRYYQVTRATIIYICMMHKNHESIRARARAQQ